MKSTSQDAAGRPDESICVFGAGVLLKHLQSLSAEVDGVLAGHDDIEYIHRARVASRRLRAALPLFEGCLPQKKTRVWLKEIRAVTRALGAARDADVQIVRVREYLQEVSDPRFSPGILRLLLRLRQQREKLQPDLSTAMRELTQSNFIAEMSAQLAGMARRADEIYIYTPTLYQHSFTSIHQQLDAFLAYDEIVRNPEEVEALHQMRIAAKQLRYTTETFAPLYANQLKPYVQAVRKAQDLLGDIHDSDVWQVFLPHFQEEERLRIREYFGHERPIKQLIPGIEHFKQDLQQARNLLYQDFLQAWQRWQADGLWKDLEGAVQVPFQNIGAIYPPAAPSK